MSVALILPLLPRLRAVVFNSVQRDGGRFHELEVVPTSAKDPSELSPLFQRCEHGISLASLGVAFVLRGPVFHLGLVSKGSPKNFTDREKGPCSSPMYALAEYFGDL